MKVLQSICKFYENVGIKPPQPNKYYSFQWKHLICLLFLIQLFCTATAFILFEAKSVVEYAEAFFPSSTEVAAVICLTVSISKISTSLQLIEKFQEFIEKSKLKVLQNLQKKY